jgi:vacuolar protein sorting-associated protein 26
MNSLFSSLSINSFNLDINVNSGRKSLSENGNTLQVFSSRDEVSGELKVSVLGGKRVEHTGIRIELKGVVELSADRSSHEFVSLAREVAPIGAQQGMQAFKFSFGNAELPFDSYSGINGKVRYYLRAVVSFKAGFGASTNQVKEVDFLVQTVNIPQPLPIETNQQPGNETSEVIVAPGGVKLEVGIEDCLHIEFVYDKTQFHLNDVVTGRVFFLLVRIKIKHMELSLVRRETAGFSGSSAGSSGVASALSGTAAVTESETLTRFEIMDGAPIKGERIPIRMFLSGLDVGPSLVGAANCLSVRYFLNLVLIDEEERRYFKQQEVTLYRESLK